VTTTAFRGPDPGSYATSAGVASDSDSEFRRREATRLGASQEIMVMQQILLQGSPQR